MNYQLFTLLVGILLIFSGTIGNGISNLLHKKSASAATDNAQSKKLG